MRKFKKGLLSTFVAIAALTANTASATKFNLTYDASQFADAKGQAALAGFEEAVAFWESQFTDDVTVELNIGFAALNPGVLAQAGSTRVDLLYHNVMLALMNDVTSQTDAIAASNLECNDIGEAYCGFTFLGLEKDVNGNDVIEHDTDGGTGDNVRVLMTQANAKALGFTEDLFGDAIGGSDGTLTFSSEFNFDFDASDGIDAGAFDFVGVAIHEIGHSLGFISGVDLYDFYHGTPTDLDPYGIASTLDLFRYSTESTALGAKDFRPGSDAYFSIDGGATNIAPMSSGRTHGDGQQASHWKDNLDIGALDPTAAPGELVDVTAFDLLAFDTIGWDLAINQVPEPSTLAIFGIAGFGLFASRRRKVS